MSAPYTPQEEMSPNGLSESSVKMEWINAGRMVVSGYQRNIRWAWVRELARSFDPEQLEPLRVSDRGDGTYAVIDGQHRLLAIREIGWGDQDIPCIVKSNMSYESEARLFAAQRNRRALTRHDIHRAAVEAKDPLALAIDESVRRVGFVLAGHPGENSLQCIAAVYKVAERYGVDSMRYVLRYSRNIWDSAPKVYAMEGIAYFLAKFPGCDRKILVAALSSEGQDRFEAQSRVLRGTIQNNTGIVGAYHIYQIYNKRVRNRKLPVWLIGPDRDAIVETEEAAKEA